MNKKLSHSKRTRRHFSIHLVGLIHVNGPRLFIREVCGKAGFQIHHK
jgi:hypothetical protein